MSVPQSNSTQTIDSPMPEADRTRCTPVAPLSRYSMRPGDQHLDLFGRQAGRLGHDGDRRPVEVGEHVDGQLASDLDAANDDQPGRDQHQQTVRQREGDDVVEHGGIRAMRRWRKPAVESAAIGAIRRVTPRRSPIAMSISTKRILFATLPLLALRPARPRASPLVISMNWSSLRPVLTSRRVKTPSAWRTNT